MTPKLSGQDCTASEKNHVAGFFLVGDVNNAKKNQKNRNNLGWYFAKAYAIMCSIGKMNTLERQEISCRYYTKAQEEKKKP